MLGFFLFLGESCDEFVVWMLVGVQFFFDFGWVCFYLKLYFFVVVLGVFGDGFDFYQEFYFFLEFVVFVEQGFGLFVRDGYFYCVGVFYCGGGGDLFVQVEGLEVFVEFVDYLQREWSGLCVFFEVVYQGFVDDVGFVFYVVIFFCNCDFSRMIRFLQLGVVFLFVLGYFLWLEMGILFFLWLVLVIFVWIF